MERWSLIIRWTFAGVKLDEMK